MTIAKRKNKGKIVWVVDYRDALNARRKPEFATKTEAEDWAKTNVPSSSERRRGGGAINRAITFGEYATKWLADIKPTLKPRAWTFHDRAINLYLRSRLGDVRIVDLRRSTIKAALVECRAAGGWDKKKQHARPLSPGSVRTIYSAIRACLQAAVEDEYLVANPAAKLGGKRGLRLEPTKHERQARVEQRVLDADESRTLADFTRRKAPAWLPLLLVYARAGLRLGEGVALEVDDFNGNGGGSLRIHQSIDYQTGKLQPSPKTCARIVDLTLSPELVRVLRAQVAGLKRRALKTGKPARWLFPTRTDKTLGPRNVNRKIGELGVAAGLPRPVSPHDLRHTYATLLIEAGCTPAYVQRQLGHSSIQLTIDTYAATAKPKLPPGLVGLLDGTGNAGESGDHEVAGQTDRAETGTRR